jgi:hypothetical protein
VIFSNISATSCSHLLISFLLCLSLFYSYLFLHCFIKLPNPSGRIRPWGLLSL